MASACIVVAILNGNSYSSNGIRDREVAPRVNGSGGARFRIPRSTDATIGCSLLAEQMGPARENTRAAADPRWSPVVGDQSG